MKPGFILGRPLAVGVLLMLAGTRGALAQEVMPLNVTTASSLPSVKFGSLQLTTGIRMHYAEQGDPSGEVIILLHGWSDSWFSFSRVLPLLSRRYHAYALDQRGHGRSQQPDSGYAMSDLAADVLAFMDARGVQRATVLGHSMGSFVARQVVAAAPERVTRLILVGSGPGLRHLPSMLDLRQIVGDLSDPVSLGFIREFQLSTVHQPLPDEFLNQVINESQRLTARLWVALMDGMLAMPSGAALGTSDAPTLLVWGDRDAIFPLPEQDSLRRQLPKASVITYQETGHAPHWERPQQFVRDLEAFLESN